MIKATSLRTKGQQSMMPSRVELLETSSDMTTLFLFPRSTPISSDAKELLFETAMGPMVLKAKFSLKDMTFDGHPAL